MLLRKKQTTDQYVIITFSFHSRTLTDKSYISRKNVKITYAVVNENSFT